MSKSLGNLHFWVNSLNLYNYSTQEINISLVRHLIFLLLSSLIGVHSEFALSV